MSLFRRDEKILPILNIYTAEVDSLVHSLNCKLISVEQKCGFWTVDLIWSEKSQYNYITILCSLQLRLAKVQALKNPNKMFFDLSTCVCHRCGSDTFTVKNSLAQMLAGGVCLEAFGTLGVLLRTENFQLQTFCQYYSKISEWCSMTAVCIPG